MNYVMVSNVTLSPGGPGICDVRKPVLKSLLLYPAPFYWYLLASNLVLRLSWTYKLSPHLRGNHNTVMLFTLLEVSTALFNCHQCKQMHAHHLPLLFTWFHCMPMVMFQNAVCRCSGGFNGCLCG